MTHFNDDQIRQSVLENQKTLRQQLRKNFDFVVCGAGSSGSVVAGRLAEDKDIQVLLLEAGGDDAEPSILEPGQWPLNLGSSRDWAFMGEPSPISMVADFPQHGQGPWWWIRHQRDGLGPWAQERLGLFCPGVRRRRLGATDPFSDITGGSRTGRARPTPLAAVRADRFSSHSRRRPSRWRMRRWKLPV